MMASMEKSVSGLWALLGSGVAGAMLLDEVILNMVGNR